MKIKSYSIRIDETLLKKFHCLCKYNGRSANSQVLFYIKQSVKKFEQEHGIIELTNEE